MRNGGGIMRLITACFISLVIILYSSYGLLFGNQSIGIAKGITSLGADELSHGGDDLSALESSSKKTTTEQSSVQSTASVSSQAVQAAASGTVKGKVVEKFITPYTANTSYGKVYLKNSTDLKIDIKSLLEAKLPYKVEKNDAPQVLIMHTHTTESFLPDERDYYTDKDESRRTDENMNMVRLGEIVTNKLNEAGVKTLHDKTMHDYPNYSGSYTRAAATINSYLKKYPSIKIVIDMHRDGISSGDSDKVKIATEIGGKKAAQVMIVMGSQSGSVTNFPKWQENLKLAVRLQQKLETKYPTLARSLSLVSKNYNESLTTGSMLIEVGTDVNTIDEVTYSAQMLGNSLAELLADLK